MVEGKSFGPTKHKYALIFNGVGNWYIAGLKL